MNGGKCLGYSSSGSDPTHPPVTLGACDGSSKWAVNNSTGYIQSVSDAGLCLKVNLEGRSKGRECNAGNSITVAKCEVTTFKFDSAKGAIELAKSGGMNCKPAMCIGVAPDGTVAEVSCADPTASKWTMV